MKTIKFKYLFIAMAMVSLGSCSEEFVNLTPKGSFVSENYYANQELKSVLVPGKYVFFYSPFPLGNTSNRPAVRKKIIFA